MKVSVEGTSKLLTNEKTTIIQRSGSVLGRGAASAKVLRWNEE